MSEMLTPPELVKKYELPKLSETQIKNNIRSIEGLINSSQKGILNEQRSNNGNYYTVELNIRRDPQNPDNFIPTDSSHLFVFSKNFGVMEFASIDKNRQISSQIGLDALISNLARNPKTNCPENFLYGIKLVSQSSEIKSDNLLKKIIVNQKAEQTNTQILTEDFLKENTEKYFDDTPEPPPSAPQPDSIDNLPEPTEIMVINQDQEKTDSIPSNPNEEIPIEKENEEKIETKEDLFKKKENKILSRVKEIMQSKIAKKGLTVCLSACLGLFIGATPVSPIISELQMEKLKNIRISDILYKDMLAPEIKFSLQQKIGLLNIKETEHSDNNLQEYKSPEITGFEKTYIPGKKFKKILDTFPKELVNNMKDIKFVNEDKSFNENNKYGFNNPQEKKIAAITFLNSFNRTARMEIYKTGLECSKEWVVNILLPHEFFHSKDWRTGFLTIEDSQKLCYSIVSRLNSPNRFRFDYVETIGENKQLNKSDVLYFKALEYYAVISATYLSENYSLLPQEDKEIVEWVIHKMDPNFNREEALNRRTQVIKSLPQWM